MKNNTLKERAKNWYKEWLEGDFGFDFNEYLADKVVLEVEQAKKEEQQKIHNAIAYHFGDEAFEEFIKHLTE